MRDTYIKLTAPSKAGLTRKADLTLRSLTSAGRLLIVSELAKLSPARPQKRPIKARYLNQVGDKISFYRSTKPSETKLGLAYPPTTGMGK